MTYCKPCHDATNRRDKGKHGGPRNYHLRRRYGITAEHYDQMLAEQAVAYLGRDLMTPVDELPELQFGICVGGADPRADDEPRVA